METTASSCAIFDTRMCFACGNHTLPNQHYPNLCNTCYKEMDSEYRVNQFHLLLEEGKREGWLAP